MQRQSYFHRVSAYTPTRLWINNPTSSEAELAVLHGAVSCTTNPAYTAKMLASNEMRPQALAWLREAIENSDCIQSAACLAQRIAAKNLMDIFLPIHTASVGKSGFVSVQGSPLKEDDPDSVIEEALLGKALAPNFIAKIPVTVAGLAAMSALVKRNIPVIATEIMSVAQTVSACEAYRAAAEESGYAPVFFVTNIAGIFDQCLRGQLDEGEIKIEPDILFQAGTVLARRQYRLMKERRYPGIMLGGGARGLHHFTEFVGGDVHITINWKGSAQTLIEKDAPVISRMDTPTPEYVLDGLMQQVPDFSSAYRLDGLRPEEYADFAPVELFRSQFITGWNSLANELKVMQEGSL